MAAWIKEIHRIPLTVGICIKTTLGEWAQTIRTIKAHQNVIVPTITITQIRMPSDRIQVFTTEAQSVMTGQTVAIRRICIF
ncbi:hypothetical protein A0O30_07940 [Pseudomonas sp. LLC-1]|nr:hypothetical protein A0O30_07940 [Pseudomonas sp. LLC-1]